MGSEGKGMKGLDEMVRDGRRKEDGKEEGGLIKQMVNCRMGCSV